MVHYLNDVEYTICDNQGDIFEQAARTYTYDTFTRFVPAFLKSDFCREEWDIRYSPFQYNLVQDNLDFILPELKKKIYIKEAGEYDQIFNPDVAHWLGFTYRQLFLITGISSRKLSSIFPIDEMCAAYPGLHTIDEDMAGKILVSEKQLQQEEKAYAEA